MTPYEPAARADGRGGGRAGPHRLAGGEDLPRLPRAGGQVPYTVINELIENLIHAYFRDVVVTTSTAVR